MFAYNIDYFLDVVIAAVLRLPNVSFQVFDRGGMAIDHIFLSEAYMADILNTIVEIWITT